MRSAVYDFAEDQRYVRRRPEVGGEGKHVKAEIRVDESDLGSI
jgi:hypothetical protein